MELMDHSIGDVHPLHNEVMKCIRVALLCMQDNPSDRTIMSDVVSMLGSETPLLSTPKHFVRTIRSERLAFELHHTYSHQRQIDVLLSSELASWG